MFRGTIRRLALAGLAVGLVSAGAAQAAAADPVHPLTFSVDKAQAQPGETVTITLTFTNPQAVDVVFSYASVNPYWSNWNQGNRYEFTSCTGGVSSCWLYGPQHNGVALTHDVVIPAGASRVTVVTYDIAADSPCGEGRSVDFSVYSHHEWGSGSSYDDMIWDGPSTDVIC